METIEATSAPIALDQDNSIKERNITLRRLTTRLEHNVLPDQDLMTSVTKVFTNIKNFIGCEKYFGEAISLMLHSTHRELRDMADRFQQLIAANGLAD